MPKAPAIYTRLSADKKNDEKAVKRQLRDCQELADRRGWPVPQVFVDDDRSAYSGKPRPRFQDMMAQIKEGTVDAVITYNLDRLVRRVAELEDFFLICDAAGVRDMATCSGDIDLGTDDGRFYARIMGAVAQKESADKSRRLRRKHQELAEHGRPSGGTRRYGFDKYMNHIVPEEVAIIRELTDRCLRGDSLHSMARDLNARAVPTCNGARWHTATIRQLLMSPRLAGQRVHHGQIVSVATWLAIITPEESAQVRAVLGNPARRTFRAPRTYLLSRLLYCGRCGCKIVSFPRPNGRSYRCSGPSRGGGCGKTVIKADPLEALVRDAVFYRLDTPEAADLMSGHSAITAEAQAAHAFLETAQRQLDELAGAYAAQQISLREWMVAREPIETRLTAARARVAHWTGLTPVSDFVGAGAKLREAWDSLSIARQQAAIRALVAKITIGPASGGGRRPFESERVHIEWRT